MIALFMLAGKLIIWTLQTAAVFDLLRRVKFFNEMLMCDFCTGFWVYLVLGFLYGQALMEPLPWNVFTLVIEALTASYVMHLISIGWRYKDA